MPLPDGYTVRPLTFVDTDGLPDGPDVDLAFEVVRAAERELSGGGDDTREAIRTTMTGPTAARDEHRLVLGPDGSPAGLLVIECDGPARVVFIEPYAIPSAPPRLLHALVGLGVEASERLATADGWQLEAGSYAEDTRLAQALVDVGLTPVRRFWRMRLDLGATAVEPPPAPSGVTRRTAAGDDDLRLIHALHQESFADHYGFTARDYDEWIPALLDRRDSRPDLWWVASLDGEPVALCLLDDSRAEHGAAYVRTLGVVRRARGRGIARWLLMCAFAQAASEGRQAVMLTVDSENVTGATALYESVGMAPAQIIDLYRRPI